MKVIRIHNYGSSDQLKIEDAPRPEVTNNEVLVKVHDAGVNPADWKIREGYLKDYIPTKFPYTLGQDFSGEIIEVGPQAQGFKVGDEVFGFAHGSYAEYAVARADKIAHKPKSIDFETAAAIPTAGLTAWQIVTETTQLQKNQRVLIQGAAGGVGSIAVQIARWKGAYIAATASSNDIEYLKNLGVEQVIDYKTERFEDKIKNLDAVIDLVGRDTLTRSYQILKAGGVLVTTVGSIDEPTAKEKNIAAVEFIMRQDGASLTELARLIDQGTIKVRISQVLQLTEAKKAQDLNQTGKSHGKIVLKVA